MINIIKQGFIPENEEKIYTITCWYCGCVYECEDDDFISHQRSLLGNSTTKCPCCGAIKEVDRTTLPVRIKYSK